jgi:integrase
MKKLIRETTKTGRGRAVHLLPEVVAALKAHRKRQLEERMAKGALWDEQDLVFPNVRGKPTNRDNLSKRHFKPILKKAGLPLDLRLYTLRHTFATLWLESGEHPKILQEILGHSRIHTTLDVYSHALPHMQREAMDRFGERFRTRTEVIVVIKVVGSLIPALV